MQVVVGGIHGERKPGRRFKGLARHRGTHFIHVGGACFFDGLRPHVNAHIGGFHRIVGYDGIGIRQLVRFGVGFVIRHEGLVGWVIHGFEVVPRRQVPHQRFGVDPTQFLFTDRERHNRNIGSLQALVSQLFVERHVGIAVDGRHHRRFSACGEFLNVGYDGLVIAVTKRGVNLFNVFILNAF